MSTYVNAFQNILLEPSITVCSLLANTDHFLHPTDGGDVENNFLEFPKHLPTWIKRWEANLRLIKTRNEYVSMLAMKNGSGWICLVCVVLGS